MGNGANLIVVVHQFGNAADVELIVLVGLNAIDKLAHLLLGSSTFQEDIGKAVCEDNYILISRGVQRTIGVNETLTFNHQLRIGTLTTEDGGEYLVELADSCVLLLAGRGSKGCIHIPLEFVLEVLVEVGSLAGLVDVGFAILEHVSAHGGEFLNHLVHLSHSSIILVAAQIDETSVAEVSRVGHIIYAVAVDTHGEAVVLDVSQDAVVEVTQVDGVGHTQNAARCIADKVSVVVITFCKVAGNSLIELLLADQVAVLCLDEVYVIVGIDGAHVVVGAGCRAVAHLGVSAQAELIESLAQAVYGLAHVEGRKAKVHDGLCALGRRGRSGGAGGAKHCPTLDTIGELCVVNHAGDIRARLVAARDGQVEQELYEVGLRIDISSAQLEVLHDVGVRTVGVIVVGSDVLLEIGHEDVACLAGERIVAIHTCLHLGHLGLIYGIRGGRVLQRRALAGKLAVFGLEVLKAKVGQGSQRIGIGIGEAAGHDGRGPLLALCVDHRRDELSEVLGRHGAQVRAVAGLENYTMSGVEHRILVLAKSLIPGGLHERIAVQLVAESAILGLLGDVGIVVGIVEEATGQRGVVHADSKTAVAAPAIYERTAGSLAGKACTILMIGGDGDLACCPDIGHRTLMNLAAHDTGTHGASRVIDYRSIDDTEVAESGLICTADEACLIVVVRLHIEVINNVILTVEGSTEVQVVTAPFFVAMTSHGREVVDTLHVDVVHQSDLDGVVALVHEAAHPTHLVARGHIVPILGIRSYSIALHAAVHAVAVLAILVLRSVLVRCVGVGHAAQLGTVAEHGTLGIDLSARAVLSGEFVLLQVLIIDNLRLVCIQAETEFTTLGHFLHLEASKTIDGLGAVAVEHVKGGVAVLDGSSIGLAGYTTLLLMVGDHLNCSGGEDVADDTSVELATQHAGTHRIATGTMAVVDDGGIHDTQVLDDGTPGSAAEETGLIVVIHLDTQVADDMALTVETSLELNLRPIVVAVEANGREVHVLQVNVSRQLCLCSVVIVVDVGGKVAQILSRTDLDEAVGILLNSCHSTKRHQCSCKESKDFLFHNKLSWTLLFTCTHYAGWILFTRAGNLFIIFFFLK